MKENHCKLAGKLARFSLLKSMTYYLNIGFNIFLDNFFQKFSLENIELGQIFMKGKLVSPTTKILHWSKFYKEKGLFLHD